MCQTSQKTKRTRLEPEVPLPVPPRLPRVDRGVQLPKGESDRAPSAAYPGRRTGAAGWTNARNGRTHIDGRIERALTREASTGSVAGRQGEMLVCCSQNRDSVTAAATGRDA